MWNHAQDAYLESRVLSADPVELIRLLYQTGVSAVQDARRCLADGKIMERSQAITKAGRVLIQLITALDHERGGEISRRLAALYDYMLRRLTEANSRQTPADAGVWRRCTTICCAGSPRPTPGSATNRWPRC